MKRIALLLALLMLCSLVACTNSDRNNNSEVVKPQNTEAPNPTPELTLEGIQPSDKPIDYNEKPEAYVQLLQAYTTALTERWGGEKLLENNMGLAMADCYGSDPFANVGYTIRDFDEDGNLELAIGATENVTDELYNKMVFALYTIDNDGSAKQLFASRQLERYYFAGDNMFASVGTGNQNYNYDTTLKLEDKEMIDTTRSTDKNSYIQLVLEMIEK